MATQIRWGNGDERASGYGHRTDLLIGDDHVLVMRVLLWQSTSLIVTARSTEEVVVRTAEGSFRYQKAKGNEIAFWDPGGQSVVKIHNGRGDVLPPQSGEEGLAAVGIDSCSDWLNALSLTKLGPNQFQVVSADYGLVSLTMHQALGFVDSVDLADSGRRNLLRVIGHRLIPLEDGAWIAAKSLTSQQLAVLE